MQTLVMLVSAFLLLVVGCSPKISVKSDLFRDRPIWTSQSMAGAIRPSKIDRLFAPGLYELSRQVTKDESILIDTRPQKRQSAQGIDPMTATFAQRFYASALNVSDDVKEEPPLPKVAADLNVTRAIVETLEAAYLGKQPPDIKLTADDVSNFAKAINDEYVAQFAARGGDGVGPREWLTPMSTAAVGEKKIRFRELLATYFTAYYMGEFVDRTGGKLGKPTIGLTVSNEMIVAHCTVFLEAICDFASIAAGSRNPIVFKQDAGKKPVWQTSGGHKPTLAVFIEKITLDTAARDALTETSPVTERIYIVEKLRADNSQPGLTREKLELVRTSSGLAGDVSGLFADQITRVFGGIDIGVAVLNGKISFGDNDTLAKLVQCTADVLIKRSTEHAVATRMYDLVDPKAVATATAAPMALRADDLLKPNLGSLEAGTGLRQAPFPVE